MRSVILLLLLLGSFSLAKGQYSSFNLSGGYAFANIENTDEGVTGFRIDANFGYHPILGKVMHGFTVSYVNTSVEVIESDQGQPIQSKYQITSWPIIYAPKLVFGEKSFKPFISAALGMQFSTFKHTGTLAEVKSTDAGFYGGAGAGVMKDFGENIFVNLEYQWAYCSNSFYRDGFLNSVMLGVGYKLQ